VYNVLLVDDDRMDLQGLLQLIPWPNLQMNVIGTASDAYAALEIARLHKVDLLVTDIKMPVMTGLELAEQIVELHPRIRIVFISAYEDFHFAKQAIALNASGYITKPYANQELMQVLERVGIELGKDEQNKLVLLSETIRKWLEGKLGGDPAIARLKEFGLALRQQELSVGLIEIDDLWRINSDPNHPAHGKIHETAGRITAVCSRFGLPLACPMDNNRIGVILDQPAPLAALEGILEQIGKQESFTVTIGFGSGVMSPDRVYASYMEAAEALSCKLFYGKNRIIQPNRTQSAHQANAADLESIFEALFVAASRYELVRIDQCVCALFAYAAELNGKIKANHFAMFILSKMDSYLSKLHAGLFDLSGLDFRAFDLLAQLETIDDMLSLFRRLMFEVSELLWERKQKKGRRLIEEVETFVRSRLADKLTLRDVADQFAFSPNYFGQMFKEETGEKFTEFLIRLRIEKARELLQDPKLKVFEVAHRVGFKKIANFSLQFKQTYGLSPGDYRKQC